MRHTCRAWLCACRTPWFGCKHHGPIGFSCRRRVYLKRKISPTVVVCESSVQRRITNFQPLPICSSGSAGEAPILTRNLIETGCVPFESFVLGDPSDGCLSFPENDRSFNRKRAIDEGNQGVGPSSKRFKGKNRKRSRAQICFFAEQEALRSITRLRLLRDESTNVAPQALSCFSLTQIEGYPSDHG